MSDDTTLDDDSSYDILLDYIHCIHNHERICTGYVLVAVMSDLADHASEEFYIEHVPIHSSVVAVGLLETATALIKARVVRDINADD